MKFDMMKEVAAVLSKDPWNYLQLIKSQLKL
jgi:hypothetical protein